MEGIKPYSQPRPLSDSHHRKSQTCCQQTGFEPAEGLSWDFVEGNCAVVISTTSISFSLKSTMLLLNIKDITL